MEIKSVNDKINYKLPAVDSNEAQPLPGPQVHDSGAKEYDERGPWTLWKDLSSKPKTRSATVASGPNLNVIEILKKYATNPNNWSALNYAIEKEDFEAALVLIDYTSDINKIDKGVNAINRLLNAVILKQQSDYNLRLSNEQMDVVKKLIQNEIDLHGQTLSLACRVGSEEIVELILSKGIDVNENYGMAIVGAVNVGNMNIIRLLISKGADVNKQHPICTAVMHKNYEAIALLLQAGAKINYENNSQPLTYAIASLDVQMVKFLLENGADPNIKMGGGAWSVSNSFLVFAFEQNEATEMSKKCKYEIVDLLLEHGAKLA